MADIAKTLSLICNKLNEYLMNTVDKSLVSGNRCAVLSNLVDHHSQPIPQLDDKIVMFLANIQHETTISTYQRNVPTANNDFEVVTPPLYINLYVMLFANFQHLRYVQGLDMISRTISFFQQNPYFNHQNLPGLDTEIDKLSFEISNLDITDLNYLLGLAGVKYLPTVYYKVRMLPFAAQSMKAETPAVRGTESAGDTLDR